MILGHDGSQSLASYGSRVVLQEDHDFSLLRRHGLGWPILAGAPGHVRMLPCFKMPKLVVFEHLLQGLIKYDIQQCRQRQPQRSSDSLVVCQMH